MHLPTSSTQLRLTVSDKPGAFRPRLSPNGLLAKLLVYHRQGRAFFTRPHVIGYTFSDEAGGIHAQPISYPPMRDFWTTECHIDRDGPGFVAGIVDGKVGSPNSPIQWNHVPQTNIPFILTRPVSRLLESVGHQVGHENIAAVRADGRSLITTHISDPADRQLVLINPNGWQKMRSSAARQTLIDQLDGVDLAYSNRQKLHMEGKAMMLRLYHDTLISSATGKPCFVDVDISCLGINPKAVYDNPDNMRYSIQIYAPDEHQDIESRGPRQDVTIFNWMRNAENKEGIMRSFREENGQVHLIVLPRRRTLVRDLITVNTICRDDGMVEIYVYNPYEPEASNRTVRFEANSWNTIEENARYQKLEGGVRQAVYDLFSRSQRIEITGNSVADVKSQVEQIESNILLPASKRLAKKLALEVFNLKHFKVSRLSGIRQRYGVQYHTFREVRIPNALPRELRPGENVVFFKAESCVEVAFVDETNGFKVIPGKPYPTAIVPLPVDIARGHPEDLKLAAVDSRGNARDASFFGTPLNVAVAGQALITPTVGGKFNSLDQGAHVDQRGGFFGNFTLDASSFPEGQIFSDHVELSWSASQFGSINGTIFAAKGEAGKAFDPFTGNQLLSNYNEIGGAGMVTGPMTHESNPALEGIMTPMWDPNYPLYDSYTAIPGGLPSMVEDCHASATNQMETGGVTITHNQAMGGGGAADNIQVTNIVQRALRWIGGKALWLADAAHRFWQDITRGSDLYRAGYKIISKATNRQSKVNPASDPLVPTPKNFTLAEAWHQFCVGTWYDVGYAKSFLRVAIVVMAATGLMGLPVIGPTFLLICLASTFISWPAWAMHVAKGGFDPKEIMSINPINIFWQDYGFGTMVSATYKVAQTAVGKFIVSERSTGNRLTAKSKRYLFWAMAVPPAAIGFGMIGGALAVSYIMSLSALALTSLPIVAGLFASRFCLNLARRIAPNAKEKSFMRACFHFAAKNGPLALGVAAALYINSGAAILAIPWAAVLMLGFWSIFVGANLIYALNNYVKDQKAVPIVEEPNPEFGSILYHRSESWRNLIRDFMFIDTPYYKIDEFTPIDGPEVKPDTLWAAINQACPNILEKPGANALDNINAIIQGEGLVLVDAWQELANTNCPDFLCGLESDTWKLSHLNIFTRRGRIARLFYQTREMRSIMAKLPRDARIANGPNRVKPEDYDRLTELNRYVLQAYFHANSPQRIVA